MAPMQNRQQAPFGHRWWNYFTPVCPYTAVRINLGLLSILKALKKLCSSYLNIDLSTLLQWCWVLSSTVQKRSFRTWHTIYLPFLWQKLPATGRDALVRAPSPSEELWRQQLTIQDLTLPPTSVSAGCATLARNIPKLWNTSFFLCLLIFSHWSAWAYCFTQDARQSREAKSIPVGPQWYTE